MGEDEVIILFQEAQKCLGLFVCLFCFFPKSRGIYLAVSSVHDLAGSHGDMKVDMANARSGEVKNLGAGRTGHSSLDNGMW